MSEFGPNSTLRNLKAGVIVLLATAAGVATALEVSSGNGHVSRQTLHAENCASTYASATPLNTEFASVISRKKLSVGLKAFDLHMTKPNCNDAEVERFTTVYVEQSGQIIGESSLIGPNNDNGSEHLITVGTTEPIGCNQAETVVFATVAGSPNADGFSVETQHSHTFTTQCYPSK